MKLEIRDSYLWGYGALAGDCPEIPDREIPRDLLDEYGNPRYRWDGKKLLLDPLPATAEQVTARQKVIQREGVVDHVEELLFRLEVVERKLQELEKTSERQL